MIQISDQLWKIEGEHLVTKANLWHSNDSSWTFSNPNDTFPHIKNTSNGKVLATKNNCTVNEGIFDENDRQQRWMKGLENSEGYFTLTNVYSQKVLTAISKDSLVTKGILWSIVYLLFVSNMLPFHLNRSCCLNIIR